MSFAIKHRETCRLCDSKEISLVVKLNPVPLAEKYTNTSEEAIKAPKYPVDLYMCRECSHVQILDIVDSQNLWDGYTYHSGQTQGIVDHFRDVSQNLISKYAPHPQSLIIDVGSNDGTLLQFFKNAGYKVLGIDPADEIARKATEAGIETLSTTLTSQVANKIQKQYGNASIVTAFNVYAHADNLGDMTDGISTLLDKDGIFVFEVHYLLDIIDKVLIGTIFHEHMSHHSTKPMIRFLDLHQLELIDVERVSIQKGSIIGVAQHKGGPRPVASSVKEMVQLEEQRNLDKLSIMEGFNQRIEKNRDVARLLIKEWEKNGWTIAGFGAARSGPMLMSQFLFDSVIQYIFDDHPQKIHRFSPGIGVPVIATSELNKKKPDVVIILAWIHARAIVEKNQEYLNNGGRFVVCTPDIRVVDKNNPLT